MVIHARLDGVVDETGRCEIEGGPVIHPQTARRLLCTARVQRVIEDHGGQVVGLGRTSREPSGWMMRQLRYRDFGCTFPGCGTGAFTTSRGGSMEAPPIWTTWFSPVPFTIGWCTNTGGQ